MIIMFTIYVIIGIINIYLCTKLARLRNRKLQWLSVMALSFTPILQLIVTVGLIEHVVRFTKLQQLKDWNCYE